MSATEAAGRDAVLFPNRSVPIRSATLVLNSDAAAWHWRKGLITALLARGIDVTVVTPGGTCVPKLIGLGARHVAIPMDQSMSPWRNLKLCLALYRLFRRQRPDLVHTMTIKPNVFGGLAARFAGVPRIVALVNGLGYSFLDQTSWKRRMLRLVASCLYRQMCKGAARVWFQNGDDLALFVASGLIPRHKAVLIRGSGVDLRDFSPDRVDPQAVAALRTHLGLDASTQVVLMTARALWSKGVRQFVEASQLAAAWGLPVVFLLAGAVDPKWADGVPEQYLRLKASPRFRWLGERRDVKELLALADVVALPSYREGVPRALLEAAAMQKPIVTTDAPGCREVVEEGKNGFLVPVRDSAALASAIEKLLRADTLRASFGRYSRAKAEAEFDEAVVVRRVLKELYGLDDAEPLPARLGKVA